jgi:hypothetical protein
LAVAGLFRPSDQAAGSIVQSYGGERQDYREQRDDGFGVVVNEEAQAVPVRPGDYAEFGNIIFRGLIAAAVCGLIYALLKRV